MRTVRDPDLSTLKETTMKRAAGTCATLLVLGLAAACARAPTRSGGPARSEPSGETYVYVVDGAGTRSRFPYVNPADGQPLSLAKLVSLRGGISATEDASRLRVARQRETGRTITAVDFTDIVAGRRPDFLLRPDDVVTIASRRR